MGKKLLIVVDCQYDFINPNGALYVKGAEKIEDNILKIIGDFDVVEFTKDAHPVDHCSFINNGGSWPIHCVEDTIGCGIPVSLFKTAKDYFCFSKGTDPMKEEYGAYEDEDEFALTLELAVEGGIYPNDEIKTIKEWIKDIDNIVLCGVAGDICVLETLKNIVKHIGTDKVSVYLDGVASIDGGIKLNTYMKENNIKIYKYESDN
jgi:nicotinamidase-related amidase